MVTVTEEIEKYFRESGWKPGRRNPVYASVQPVSNALADAIFREFGGLKVESNGQGQQMAAGNVYFLASPIPAKAIAVSKWRGQLGSLIPIADAHNEHMMIYVSESGDYYFYTDPDEKLYFGSHSFSEAMCKLLLGQRFGPEV